jgi:protein-tyrosine kinase
MSIIERTAELLERIAQSKASPSTRGQSHAGPGLDLIERVVDDRSKQSTSSEAGGLPVTPAAAALVTERMPGPSLARPADSTTKTRTLRIDLDRLRRQSIVTPGGKPTPTGESFRRIKRRVLANVVSGKADGPANLVLVTSALPGEGKTFCAVNLAISIALEVDHSVLLVDGDVRKPSFPEVLGLAAEKGLMDLLADRRIDLRDVLWRTDIDKLTLLPSGSAHQDATELLASATARQLLRELAERYHDRIVIFDSPPLLLASETSVLASQMAQIIMVVESGKTTESAFKEALGRIDANRLTGVVLNKGGALENQYGGYGYPA